MNSLFFPFASSIFIVLSLFSTSSGQTESDSSKLAAFRVDTDIYLDETKPPIKRTLTLFLEGVFYDFEEDGSQQLTVIDPQRNEIVLLNRQSQTKLTLSLDQLRLNVASARVQADAKFTAIRESKYVDSQNGAGSATIRNDFMEYRAITQSVPQTDIATQYAEFADWSARLNAVTQPKLPPYLRMDLNKLVADHAAIPAEIRRRTHQDGREVTIISRHIANWRLSQDDHARIARCGSMRAEFRESSWQEFWSPIETASNTTSASNSR